MTGRSLTHRALAPLAPGDSVPSDCYVLDHADGTAPRWLVHSVTPMRAGVWQLVLVDDTNRLDDGDLFTPGTPVAVVVLTWPAKTMRSQPFLLGRTPGPTLCDLDQQARHVARAS